MKDNNSSPRGKFYRFLFPFSNKFSDLNFASYVLFIYYCDTHSEPGFPVMRQIIQRSERKMKVLDRKKDDKNKPIILR